MIFDIKAIFGLTEIKNTLTLSKPPVSRGAYRLELSEDAQLKLDVAKNKNLAIVEYEGNIMAAVTDAIKIEGTLASATINRNGTITSKSYHILLSSYFKIDWETNDTFELDMVFDGTNPLVFQLVPRVPITDEEIAQKIDENLAEVEGAIAEAEESNRLQPIEVA